MELLISVLICFFGSNSLLQVKYNQYRVPERKLSMGFLVTTLIFLVVGIIASLSARICFNRGPSANLYVLHSSFSIGGSSIFVNLCGFLPSIN